MLAALTLLVASYVRSSSSDIAATYEDCIDDSSIQIPVPFNNCSIAAYCPVKYDNRVACCVCGGGIQRSCYTCTTTENKPCFNLNTGDCEDYDTDETSCGTDSVPRCIIINTTPSPPPPPPSVCVPAVYSTPKNWVDAEAACVALGGHLLSIHSQAEQDTVYNLITNANLSSVWIGYNDREAEAGCTDDHHPGIGAGNVVATSMTWSDGTDSDYQNWYPDEPNDALNGTRHCDGTGNEDCTEVRTNSTGQWFDADCALLKPYLCGNCPPPPPPPLPTTCPNGESITVLDLCASGPCQHDGQCQTYPVECPTSFDAECFCDLYTCDCVENYGGQDCETVIDLCDPDPCLNGEPCVLTYDLASNEGCTENCYTCGCPGTSWGADCGYPGPLNTSAELYAYVYAVCSGQTVCDLTEMRWNPGLTFEQLFYEVKQKHTSFDMDTITNIDISNLNLSVYNGSLYEFGWDMFRDSSTTGLTLNATVNVSGTIIKYGYRMFRSFNGTLVGTPTIAAGAILRNMFESTPEHFSVDLSYWNLSAVSDLTYIFENSNSRVNVSGTIIKDGAAMFASFNGTLVGTPTFAAGADLIYMFLFTPEHFSVDLSYWNLSAVYNVYNMFGGSNATVNVSGTIIKNGYTMFPAFNGTLVGTPTIAAGADLKYMFLSTPEHVLDVRLWSFSGTMNLDGMFYNSKATVLLTPEQNTLLEARNAFNNFHGSKDISYFDHCVPSPCLNGETCTRTYSEGDNCIEDCYTCACPGTSWGPGCAYSGLLTTNAEVYAYVNDVCSGQTVCDLTEMRWDPSLSFTSLFYEVEQAHGSFDMETVTKVDISNLDLSTVDNVNFMFSFSNATVNVSGTIIKDGNSMFLFFNGTLVGTPTFAAGSDLIYMFDSTSELASVDLSHWNLSAVSNVYYMFKASKATVNVSGTIIKKGVQMFRDFNGTLVGTPTLAAGADLSSMFEFTPKHLDVDLSHWNMSAVGDVEDMFRESNATVNVSGTIIKKGVEMFGDFNGTLVGTPTFTADAILTKMFSGSSGPLDVRLWSFSSTMNLENMFEGSTATVTLTPTQDILLSEWHAFDAFNGVKEIAYCYADASNFTAASCPHILFVGATVPKLDCTHLESLEAPDAVGNIVIEAFEDCHKLEHVSFPKLDGNISSRAFKNCANLKNAFFPSLLGNIFTEAFMNTPNLMNVDFNMMRGDISNFAFKESGITEAYFPNMTGSIGIDAFSNCGNLTSAHFPKMAKDIAVDAFLRCTKLTAVNFESMTGSIDASAFSNTAVVDFNFPKMTGTIGRAAFYNITTLESASFPAMTGDIDLAAFAYCSNLHNVSFPALKGSIGSASFNECTNLKTVHFPAMTGNISIAAFYDSGIVNASFPAMKGFVGNASFGQCHDLTNLDLGQASGLRSNVFEHSGKLAKLCLREATEVEVDALVNASLTAIHMPKLNATHFSAVVGGLCNETRVCNNTELAACGAVLPKGSTSTSDDGLIIGLSAGGGVLVLAGLVYFLRSRMTTPKYQQLLLF